MDTADHKRSAIAAMYAGLGLTVAAAIVPYVDHATANVLAGHIRAGYPAYTQARIASAVTTYLIYLSVVGALGAICWLWAIWAVKAGKRSARGAATAMFALGTGIAVTDLLFKDTSGDTGLPPLLGWAGMLPCLAGLLAVALLWRRSGAHDHKVG
jgi:alkylation response protein AidB-like acyl-CoA dehydrogenase